MGYAYRPTLRKGLLLHSDLKKRLQFAKDVVKHFDASTLWMKEIKFYFDGKSFVHKYTCETKPGLRVCEFRGSLVKSYTNTAPPREGTQATVVNCSLCGYFVWKRRGHV